MKVVPTPPPYPPYAHYGWAKYNYICTMWPNASLISILLACLDTEPPWMRLGPPAPRTQAVRKRQRRGDHKAQLSAPSKLPVVVAPPPVIASGSVNASEDPGITCCDQLLVQVRKIVTGNCDVDTSELVQIIRRIGSVSPTLADDANSLAETVMNAEAPIDSDTTRKDLAAILKMLMHGRLDVAKIHRRVESFVYNMHLDELKELCSPGECITLSLVQQEDLLQRVLECGGVGEYQEDDSRSGMQEVEGDLSKSASINVGKGLSAEDALQPRVNCMRQKKRVLKDIYAGKAKKRALSFTYIKKTMKRLRENASKTYAPRGGSMRWRLGDDSADDPSSRPGWAWNLLDAMDDNAVNDDTVDDDAVDGDAASHFSDYSSNDDEYLS